MIHILQNSPIKLYNSMTFSKFIELYNSMTFSIFIELFNHYHNQIFNIFITRQFTFTEIRNMFGSFTPTVFRLFDSAVLCSFLFFVVFYVNLCCYSDFLFQPVACTFFVILSVITLEITRVSLAYCSPIQSIAFLLYQ